MSGLEKHLIPIVLNRGVDTKSNNKVAASTDTLVDLQNAVFTATERLTKRNGFTSFPRTIRGVGTMVAGAALANHGEELLMADGTNLYSYSSNFAAGNAWISKGPLLSPTVKTQPLMSTQYSLAGYDAAVSTYNLCCVVAEQWSPSFFYSSKGVVYSIVDINRGNVLVPPTLVNGSSTTTPKVIYGSGFFFVFYVLSGVLRCMTIDEVTFATVDVAITSGTGTTALGTSQCYDVLISGGFVFTAFVNASATNGITAFRSAAATPGTVINTAIVASANQAYAVSLCVDTAGNIVEVFSTSANLQVNAVTASSLSGVAGPTVLDTSNYFGSVTCVPYLSGGIGKIQVYANVVPVTGGTTPDDTNRIRQCTVTAPAYTGGGGSDFCRSVSLAGRALYLGGLYVPVTFGAGNASQSIVKSAQATFFLMNANAVAVLKAYAGNHGGMYVNKSTSLGANKATALPESTSFGSQLLFPAAVVTNLAQNALTTFLAAGYAAQTCSIGAVVAKLSDSTNGYISTQLAGETLFSGGIVTSYDGGQSASGYPAAVEHGFNYYPFGLSIATGAGTAGTYQYVACYEWTDQIGAVHRSAPSVPVTTTNLGGTVTIPTLRVTQKQNTLRGGVRITLYRTVTTGSVFYQVNNTGAASDALLNDPTVDTVTYVDSLTDAAASANAQLYTTGGVLQNYAPNPLAGMITHRNRVWGIDTTSPLSLWYSKQVTQGTNVAAGSPVEFSAFLTFNVDPKGGACTALASLDDKLIIFKADRIFAVTGQGPDSTGAQNDFSDAQLVTGDTGCTTPKSIVNAPMGILFQGNKGIYMLTRDLQCTYIGAPVENYVTAPISGAVLVPTNNQVRFILQSNASMAVWDYFVNQWCVFNTSADTPLACTIWRTSTTATPKMVWMSAAGYVFGEVFGQQYDVIDAVQTGYGMSLTTSWLSFAGQQGFKRVRRLLIEGNAKTGTGSPDTFTVTISYNYGDNNPSSLTPPAQTVTIDPSTFYNAGTGDFQARIHLAQQKCDSIQIGILDNAALTGSNYFDLTAITLEAAVKRGAMKLAAAASN